MKLILRLAFVSFVVSFLLPAEFSAAGRADYPNPLNIKTQITDPKDVNRSFFSDMGAWHAYALPERKEDYGSFIGPLIMDMNGRWLGNSFSKLFIEEGGKLLDLSSGRHTQEYFPGLLRQKIEVAGLVVIQELIFVSNREAMIKTRVTNLRKSIRKLRAGFHGDLLLEGTSLKSKNRAIQVRFEDKAKLFEIDFESELVEALTAIGNSYSAEYEKEVKPQESITIVQTHRYFLAEKEVPVKRNVWNFGEELMRNETRWNGYLDKYLSAAKLDHLDKKRLAVKAIVTLQTNWRSAAKDLKHDGVFPSASYQGFYGFWSWDSWKHAVALAKFNPKLAESSILSMFDYQDEHGMVADCIYADKTENNWRDTKPPLAGWAVWELYKETENTEFVEKIYPKLVKYHRWWYKNRDHDQNGLAEYGSTDGTKKAAGWESGMDNAVRFDDAKMVKNNENAWSFDQESVDLNAYLYAEKRYLARLARVLGDTRESLKWISESRDLRKELQKKFFDKNKGYFYDYSIGRKQKLSIEGTEGWIPLWAASATKEQAKDVKAKMTNPAKFKTTVPLPTLTADHQKFDPLDGYWRGPVWLDQFYFGIEGLRKYGFDDDADELTAKLFKNAKGLMTNGEIRENYHPLSGDGLNAKNFSWSAAHVLMLLENRRQMGKGAGKSK